MTTLNTRTTSLGIGVTAKGSPLTNEELDLNFISLNDNKVEQNSSAALTYAVMDPTAAASAPDYAEGTIYYDSDAKTLQVYGATSSFNISVGEREWVRCRNTSAGTILKGQPVYVTGVHIPGHPVHGHHPTVDLASAAFVNSKDVLGLAAEDIEVNDHGYVIVRGYIEDVDTSAFESGKRIHLGATSGTLTQTAPDYPYFPMDLGICLTASSTGTLYVNIFDHAFERLRVTDGAYIDGDLVVGGSFTTLNTGTVVSLNSINLADDFIYLGAGDQLTSTFTGAGLNDLTFRGHYESGIAVTYYVQVDSTGTTDTFTWGYDSSFATVEASGVNMSTSVVDLAAGIGVEWVAATGHTSGDTWQAAAVPFNTDFGIIGNYTSGNAYTHAGLFRDSADNKFKLFERYDPEIDSNIDTTTGNYTAAQLDVQRVTFAGTTVKLGTDAGLTDQGVYAIAIGEAAGQTGQGTDAIAIGEAAGNVSQSSNSVSIGIYSGNSFQRGNAVAIGSNTASNNQGTQAVAIGYTAGQNNQSSYSIAIGAGAGNTGQGSYAVALGYDAGKTNQASTTGYAISIGTWAGETDQGDYGIALGRFAGNLEQGYLGLALGDRAGQDYQGDNAIAMGYSAGRHSQCSNSIIINATGTALNSPAASSLTIKPIRAGSVGSVYNDLSYDTSTGEVLHASPSIRNVEVTVLTAGTAATWTANSSTLYAQVIATGGGGGGGGADGADTGSGAGAAGGGAGGTAIKIFTKAQLGATALYTIGAGGNGGSNAGGNGTAGGATTFDPAGTGATLTANGGALGGGSGAPTVGAYDLGGDGGTAAGGDINLTGGDGGSGSSADAGEFAIGGHGGNSYWGGGGKGGAHTAAGSNPGQTGHVYGSGGGGAAQIDTTTGQVGGAGFAGVVHIIEYLGG